MTQEKLIVLLMFLMMVEVLCMRYFWLRSEAAEKENKELKAEIERKDRLLEAWENGEYLKRLQTLSEEEKVVYLRGEWLQTGHPCESCGDGWAFTDGDDVFHTCDETCEKLAAWNKQLKKETDHETD